jgi:hypothetical protein
MDFYKLCSSMPLIAIAIDIERNPEHRKYYTSLILAIADSLTAYRSMDIDALKKKCVHYNPVSREVVDEENGDIGISASVGQKKDFLEIQELRIPSKVPIVE